MPSIQSRVVSFALFAAAVAAPFPALSQVFEVVQVSSSGATTGSGASGDVVGGATAITRDGQRVAFSSLATNLADFGGSTSAQVLLSNFASGAAVISLQSAGSSVGNGASGAPRSAEEQVGISRDGSFLVFPSLATNFGTLQPNFGNIFRIDTRIPLGNAGRVSLVSVVGASEPADISYGPSISDDGNIVVFSTDAVLDATRDQNTLPDVYVRVMSTGAVSLLTRHVNQVDGGLAGTGFQASINGAGNAIVFTSSGDGFYAGTGFVDTKPNTFNDVLIKSFDQNDSGFFVFRPGFSFLNGGQYANGNNDTPAVSANGLAVAFRSEATNLITTDTNSVSDVYVAKFTFDTNNGFNRTSLDRISTSAAGAQANGPSGINGVSISDDGNLVAFTSQASNLVPGVSSAFPQIYVKDLTTGRIKLVSSSVAGAPANGACGRPRLSGDGTYVTFSSLANNLLASPIESDTSSSDVFRVRFSTPIPLIQGQRPAPPPQPLVRVSGNDATITLGEFFVGKKSKKKKKPNRATLAALERATRGNPKGKPAKKTILYQAVITNVSTGKITRRNSKKNVLTLNDLAPGSYTTTYKVQLKQGKRTLVSTPNSPAAQFSIS